MKIPKTTFQEVILGKHSFAQVWWIWLLDAASYSTISNATKGTTLNTMKTILNNAKNE